MIKKYRKKPVEIEAIQWNGLNIDEIKRFVGEQLEYKVLDVSYTDEEFRPYVELEIKTLEGKMLVSGYDFIIKSVKGEFYPCKPDIFKQIYEEVINE